MPDQGTLYVRNWTKFQHYKDRNPPWIKLHTNVFENYEFSCLSDASKLLAIGIWTLASRSPDGHLTSDLRWIKAQCKFGRSIQKCHLNELIKKGFITLNASSVLAERKQVATSETETEREPITPTPLPCIIERKVADHRLPNGENQKPKTKGCEMPECKNPAPPGERYCDTCRDYANQINQKYD